METPIAHGAAFAVHDDAFLDVLGPLRGGVPVTIPGLR